MESTMVFTFIFRIDIKSFMFILLTLPIKQFIFFLKVQKYKLNQVSQEK